MAARVTKAETPETLPVPEELNVPEETPDAPQVETAAETVAPVAEVFTMGASELAAIKRSGGRTPKPGKYVEQIRSMIGNENGGGIRVPEGTKGSSIIVELRKSAKQLGVHLRIWDRSDPVKSKLPEGQTPFVGFKVVEKEAPGHTDPVAEDASGE